MTAVSNQPSVISKKRKRMSNSVTCFTLCALLVALCSLAEAQQPKRVPRVGYLSLMTPQYGRNRLGPFRQGLRELGYIEGQNIVIEFRDAEGKLERVSDLVAELVRLNPDVIVAASRGARVAHQLTKTIPIVALGTSDVVTTGLVESLARPGGNVTGLSAVSPQLNGKRLELLKDTFPKISRVAYLHDAAEPSHVVELKDLHVAAAALKVTLQPKGVRHPDEFAQAFAEIVRERSDALLTAPGGLNNVNRKNIVELAAKTRLPAMYPVSIYVDEGGLMSYAISLSAMYRRAAWYVDKILKGAKPADLPVEQPTKFELIINLKTAKQIGVTIPPGVLMEADKVIK
jgi:putative ABC transport system substrate-binding protein